MNNFEKVYEENKKLDALFAEKFKKKESDVLVKNMIALICELGELANETKLFKYLPKKNTSKEKILDEYVDCLMMVLFFANTLDMNLAEEATFPIEENINKQLLYLFQLAAKLPDNYEVSVVSEILINLIHLGDLLNLNEEEVCVAALNKIKVTREKVEKI